MEEVSLPAPRLFLIGCCFSCAALWSVQMEECSLHAHFLPHPALSLAYLTLPALFLAGFFQSYALLGQMEERTLWENPEGYVELSPFFHVPKIASGPSTLS